MAQHHRPDQQTVFGVYQAVAHSIAAAHRIRAISNEPLTQALLQEEMDAITGPVYGNRGPYYQPTWEELRAIVMKTLSRVKEIMP